MYFNASIRHVSLQLETSSGSRCAQTKPRGTPSAHEPLCNLTSLFLLSCFLLSLAPLGFFLHLAYLVCHLQVLCSWGPSAWSILAQLCLG